MVNHFRSIGIHVESIEDMIEIYTLAMQNSTQYKTDIGYVLQWTSSDGPELWLHLNKQRVVLGGDPAFHGESSIKASATRLFCRPNDTKYEGGVFVWVNPKEDNLNEGEFPITFDLVDKVAYGNLVLPFLSEISVSAFADSLKIFESEEMYMKAMENEKLKLAPESNIHLGLFQNKETPDSNIMMSGKIIKHKQMVNPLTNNPYYWILLKSLGGTVDVVADPDFIHAPLEVGGIISGTFWLAGRIKNPKVKKGFFSQWFKSKPSIGSHTFN